MQEVGRLNKAECGDVNLSLNRGGRSCSNEGRKEGIKDERKKGRKERKKEKEKKRKERRKEGKKERKKEREKERIILFSNHQNTFLASD